ncbi:DUF7715 family protein [Actinoplanes teichomyceticus]|uniref:DUF7715 domain-containing protein n=1 Tax=Actinoplanes teichomyceticus TaxID=1867 RepID=A0A561WI75_ACTTI|nr:hypothetical protein [Actinoplanes teichomyceticus]TWG23582.1 hypothetical protein FHX34_102131 [Actinoplanes teichomyceticus]GIF16208.1 hypothetical protein Ate01nite_62400 [Actinoplanes teichomyceticus]
MKALIATHRTQGNGTRDFTFCVPGELVYLGAVCDRDARDPDSPGACGCARAFTGLNSGKATTTAEVGEVPLSTEDYREAVRSSLERAGWTSLGVDPEEIVAELIEIAAQHPVGTVLGRRVDDVMVRD